MGCVGSTETLERLESDHHLSQISCDGCYDECTSINRLKNTLKYYNEWEQKQQQKSTNNTHSTRGIYEHLCSESDNGVTELLQDYHHFISKHSHEYEPIYNNLTASINTPCNHKNCPMMRRNHRDRSNINSEQKRERRRMYTNYKDHNEVITRQFLDQIHVYTLHQYDMGLRLTKAEEAELESTAENEDENDANCIQSEFNNDVHINRTLQSLPEQIGRIIRKKKEIIGRHPRSQTTVNNMDTNNKFMSILSVDDAEANADDAMFSFGVRFFYDDCYKDNECLDVEFNKGSYTYKDWYVAPKYQNLKIELLQNGLCNLSKSQYKDLYLKSKAYLKCQHIKQNCQHIKLSNLMSMMIYCNFDELQRELTKTYRRINPNESDESLKKRHSEFCCLGDILRRTVEKNGISVQKGFILLFLCIFCVFSSVFS